MIVRFVFRLVSILFHPIFIPLYSIYLYFFIDNYQNKLIKISDSSFLGALYTLMLLIGVLFPLLSVFIMYRTRIISSFTLPKRKERSPIIFIVFVYYVMAYFMYRSWNITYYNIIEGFVSFLFGGIIVLFIAFIINNFYKISLHALAIGSMTGGFLALARTLNPIININSLIIINCVLLFSMGLVASSRLYLKAHTSKQIYLGLIIGFVIEYYIVLYKIIL